MIICTDHRLIAPAILMVGSAARHLVVKNLINTKARTVKVMFTYRSKVTTPGIAKLWI